MPDSDSDLPRPEHPRPQFFREDWATLNGEWCFKSDPGNSGLHRGWALDPAPIDERILVPFCPESRLSGIANTDFMPVVWYARRFAVPRDWSGRRVLLHFGAVDFECRIWLNGQEVGGHRGGSASFAIDVSDALVEQGDNQLVLRVEDDIRSGLQPAGKQSVRHESFAASYTRTTGIWQSVWLEAVAETRIDSVQTFSDTLAGRFVFVPRLLGLRGGERLTISVTDGEQELARVEEPAADGVPLSVDLPAPRLWSTSDPHLYDVVFELRGTDERYDKVESYAGLREFRVEKDRFLLNGEPIFLRLILDQGFYPDGIWTAPSDEALRADIESAQALGFNGARLHQKVFEERFHYWADRLGYLTWGEFADWGIEGLNFFPPREDAVVQERALANHRSEWSEVVVRDRNHPSIIVWTPFNEANRRKGRERLYDRSLREIYALTKALDPTRPVHDASGWTHVETDVFSVHDYEQDPKRFHDRYADDLCDDSEGRAQFGGLPGVAYQGQPYVVDEYGGTWWEEGAEDQEGWGYGARPSSAEEALVRIEALTAVLLENPRMAGFCYTQLTDIEQERNGLYTDRRNLKFNASRLKAAIGAPSAMEARKA